MPTRGDPELCQEEEVKEQDRRAVEVDRERRARRPPDDDRWPLCLFLPGRGAHRQRLSGPAPPAAAFACRLTSRTRFWRSTGRLLLRLSPQREKHCVFVESQRFWLMYSIFFCLDFEKQHALLVSGPAWGSCKNRFKSL